MEIDRTTIAEVHEVAVASIMKTCRGIDIETSPGKWEKTWEYPDLVTVIIRKPQMQPQVSEACNFGPGFIAQYKNDLCHLKTRSEYPEGQAPEYTYPWRIFDYPTRINLVTGGVFMTPDSHGNGDGFGINQIDQIVSRLLKNHESRRALGITWVPELDGVAVKDQPCLQNVHFLIRENALHLRCFFRSHDFLGGASANWVGLTGLMELVREKLIAGGYPSVATGYPHNLEIGSLTTCSSSAHLYWKRDEKDLDDFKAMLFKKYHIFIEEE
jgi:thymidylate synthase